MKYRHAFHAGNFADVHKHVALVALLRALQRKERGLLHVDTHAGRGRYALGSGDAAHSNESADGITRVIAAIRGGDVIDGSDDTAEPADAEITDYLAVVRAFRRAHGAHDYPGSPLIAAALLRPQDRGIALEMQPAEFEALRSTVGRGGRLRVEHGDGYARLRALLPPLERRALVLIDPPYEETREDWRRIEAALNEALKRFATGVYACWYPIKDARDTDRRLDALGRALGHHTIALELDRHPADSRAGLNGSGLLIVNPPYLYAERAALWQPRLAQALGIELPAPTRVRILHGERR